MQILIVEDQWMIASALSAALQSAGHGVVGAAASSSEALLFAQGHRIELALVDIDLEKRGIGLQLARQLHSAYGIAVVFTTGQPALARSCECALGLFAKPYDPDDIALAMPAIASILAGTRTAPNSIPAAFELFAFAGKEKGAGVAKPRLQPVLLVEDRPQDVELALAALKECTVANPIVIAGDGVEALDYLRSDEDEGLSESDRPVLMLLDINMPRLDGLGVLERIKKHSTLRVIPIVMLSASRHEHDVLNCRREGAADFIVKPNSLKELIERLQGLNRFWTLH